MTVLINNGWLWLYQGADSMKLACRSIEYNNPRNPEWTDYNGGGSYVFDFKEKSLVVKVKGIIFKTEANKDTFLSTFNTWQDAGTFNLKIQRNTDGTFDKLDGTNTIMPVMSTGPDKVHKLGNENCTVWEVGAMTFRKGGDLS